MAAKEVDSYTDQEEQAAIDKLFVVVKVLECICNASTSVKLLKNHTVHGYREFLFSLASGSCISRGELKLLIREAHELNQDFLRSRNKWVKERTQSVVDLMQENIDGNFDVKPRVFALIDEDKRYVLNNDINNVIRAAYSYII